MHNAPTNDTTELRTVARSFQYSRCVFREVLTHRFVVARVLFAFAMCSESFLAHCYAVPRVLELVGRVLAWIPGL